MLNTPMTFFGDSLFASSARWKSVSDESKQKHYMIPQDEEKRAEMFENVKKEVIGLSIA